MGFVHRIKIDGFKVFFRYLGGTHENTATVYVNTQSQFQTGLKDVAGYRATLSEAQAEEARALNPKDSTWGSGDIPSARRNLQVNGYDLEEE